LLPFSATFVAVSGDNLSPFSATFVASVDRLLGGCLRFDEEDGFAPEEADSVSD